MFFKQDLKISLSFSSSLNVLSSLRHSLNGIQKEFLIFPLLRPFLGSEIFPSNLSLLLASITLNFCSSKF